MLLRRAIAPALARSLRTPALPRSGASAIASRAYRATPRAAAGYFKHFPTAANPADTDEFEFTPESEEKIKAHYDELVAEIESSFAAMLDV